MAEVQTAGELALPVNAQGSSNRQLSAKAYPLCLSSFGLGLGFLLTDCSPPKTRHSSQPLTHPLGAGPAPPRASAGLSGVRGAQRSLCYTTTNPLPRSGSLVTSHPALLGSNTAISAHPPLAASRE